MAKRKPDLQPGSGLPDQIGPLLRATTRTYGRKTGPLHIEIQGDVANAKAAMPMMATLRSQQFTWREAVSDVPLVPLWLFTVGAFALKMSRGDLVEAAAAAFGGIALAAVKRVIGKRPTLTFLAIDDHIDVRIESGKTLKVIRCDHVTDARVGEPVVKGTDQAPEVLEIVTRDDGTLRVNPADWGVRVDTSTLTTLAYAMKIATGLETPLPPKPKAIERRAVTRAAPVVGQGCPHTKESLEHEPGPLDLERCLACKGALVPAHQVQELVEHRFGLTKAELDDIAAQFGGLTTTCVACGGRMRPVRLRGVYVHMCRGCGAMWLDEGEDRAFLSLYGEGLHR